MNVLDNDKIYDDCFWTEKDLNSCECPIYFIERHCAIISLFVFENWEISETQYNLFLTASLHVMKTATTTTSM